MIDVISKIKSIMVGVQMLDISKILDESEFMLDLGMDSLDVTELLFVIEKEFKIVIPDGEVTDIRSVEELSAYVEKKIQE